MLIIIYHWVLRVENKLYQAFKLLITGSVYVDPEKIYSSEFREVNNYICCIHCRSNKYLCIWRSCNFMLYSISWLYSWPAAYKGGDPSLYMKTEIIHILGPEICTFTLNNLRYQQNYLIFFYITNVQQIYQGEGG